jgi:hypothetical protein
MEVGDILDLVISLAKAVHEKYESVKALKPACEQAREVAKSVSEILIDLKAKLKAVSKRPPMDASLEQVRQGLSEMEKVLEECASRPRNAKLYSKTNLGKLKAAQEKMHEALQRISAAAAGVAVSIEVKVDQVSKDLSNFMAELDSMIEDTIMRAMQESTEELLRALQQEGYATHRTQCQILNLNPAARVAPCAAFHQTGKSLYECPNCHLKFCEYHKEPGKGIFQLMKAGGHTCG